MTEAEEINLNQEFLNITEEDAKIINRITDEFKEMKVLNYGCLIYIHNNEEISHYPHVSELLENYEKIYSKDCYTGNLVFKNTKYYIIHNDGFVIVSDNGFGDILVFFKVKTLLIFYQIRKTEHLSSVYNKRILSVLKTLNII